MGRLNRRTERPKAAFRQDLGGGDRIVGVFDSLWAQYERNGDTRTRDEIAYEWHRRSDKEQNILAPVEDQCEWLRQIGFRDVDCFFRLFQVALFGGIKPE